MVRALRDATQKSMLRSGVGLGFTRVCVESCISPARLNDNIQAPRFEGVLDGLHEVL
jgi:hypothetical protein